MSRTRDAGQLLNLQDSYLQQPVWFVMAWVVQN